LNELHLSDKFLMDGLDYKKDKANFATQSLIIEEDLQVAECSHD